MFKITRLLATFLVCLGLIACATPNSDPDKTVAGALLGAGWGAGTGAVVGNQVDNTGAGAGIGAGFGFVGGAMTGYGMDAVEDTQVMEQQELDALRVQNMANARRMARLQDTLDNSLANSPVGLFYQVFFDADQTNLRAGATSALEAIVDNIKLNPSAYVVNVVGHSDDAGTPEYNQRLAEARARAVAAYLSSHGVSWDQIRMKSHGSSRPIASNNTEVGRQLNRRVDLYVGN